MVCFWGGNRQDYCTLHSTHGTIGDCPSLQTSLDGCMQLTGIESRSLSRSKRAASRRAFAPASGAPSCRRLPVCFLQVPANYPALSLIYFRYSVGEVP